MNGEQSAKRSLNQKDPDKTAKRERKNDKKKRNVSTIEKQQNGFWNMTENDQFRNDSEMVFNVIYLCLSH